MTNNSYFLFSTLIIYFWNQSLINDNTMLYLLKICLFSYNYNIVNNSSCKILSTCINFSFILHAEHFLWLQKMGNIDDAVPFFGENFNKIYPLIMVVYTVLVASNFFDRIISFFGNWKIFKFQTEADDLDGFDSSGLLILQKGKCINFFFQMA